MSYYDRRPVRHPDGTLTYATAADAVSEAQVARVLAGLLQAELITMPALCPVDWLAHRDGRIVAVADLKTRSSVHDPVWLNLRKFTALMLTAAGLQSHQRHPVAPLFVVRFPQTLHAVNVCSLPQVMTHPGGCRRVVKSDTDIELVIDVPLSAMVDLTPIAGLV